MASLTPIRKNIRNSNSRSSTENSINGRLLNSNENAIDDHERMARRSVYRSENELANTSAHQSIALMDMQEIKDHIKLCQKLFYENKINIHNAWNVRIIDCINQYVSNNEIDAETILVAATTLDICIKVYGYKLEYLGKEIIKLIQTIQPKKDHQKVNVAADDNIEDIEPRTSRDKRRKKHSKYTIAKDMNTLLCKEIPKIPSVNFGDRHDVYASSSENMSINRIPMDHSASIFKLLNNVENGFLSYGSNDATLRDESFPIVFQEIQSLSICPQFHNFNVDELDDGYNNNSSISSEVPPNLNLENDGVVHGDDGFPVLDLNLSIHDEFEDNVNDADIMEEIGTACQAAQRGVSVITSLCPSNELVRNACGNATRPSSLMCSILMGPSHWKNKLVRPVPSFSGKSNTEEPPPAKRRKIAERKYLDFAGSVTDINMKDQIRKTICLTINKCTLLPNHLCSRPDFDTLNEIALIPTKEYHLRLTNEVESEPTPEQPLYNNSMEFAENDISNADDSLPDGMVEENNNIVASTPVKQNDIVGININTQVYVPYAIRAKRVNMKKLKKVMWECLVGNYEHADNMIASGLKSPLPSKFSVLYKMLPDKLPRKVRSEISVPLAFFCLLHLTNEHNLKLTACPNYNDVQIG